MNQARLNLIPRDLRGDLFELPVPVAAVLVGLLLVYALGSSVLYKILAHRQQSLKTELSAKYSDVNYQVTDLQTLEGKYRVADSLIRKRIVWSEGFKELSIVIPPGIWLNQFQTSSPKVAKPESAKAPPPQPKSDLLSQLASPSMAAFVGAAPVVPIAPAAVDLVQNQLVLEGSAESAQAVSDFYSALEQSHFYRPVRIVYSERNEKSFPMLYKFKFIVPEASPGGKR